MAIGEKQKKNVGILAAGLFKIITSVAMQGRSLKRGAQASIINGSVWLQPPFDQFSTSAFWELSVC